jgi:hypothetical protein
LQQLGLVIAKKKGSVPFSCATRTDQQEACQQARALVITEALVSNNLVSVEIVLGMGEG